MRLSDWSDQKVSSDPKYALALVRVMQAEIERLHRQAADLRNQQKTTQTKVTIWLTALYVVIAILIGVRVIGS